MKIICTILGFIMGFCAAYFWLIPYETSTSDLTSSSVDLTSSSADMASSSADLTSSSAELTSSNTNITASEDDLTTATDYASSQYQTLGLSSNIYTVNGNLVKQAIYNKNGTYYLNRQARAYQVEYTSEYHITNFTWTSASAMYFYAYNADYQLQIYLNSWRLPTSTTSTTATNFTSQEALYFTILLCSAESTTEPGDDQKCWTWSGAAKGEDGYIDIVEYEEDEALKETLDAIFQNGYLGYTITISTEPIEDTITITNANSTSTLETTTTKIQGESDSTTGILFAQMWSNATGEEASNNFAILIERINNLTYYTYRFIIAIGYSPAYYMTSPNLLRSKGEEIIITSNTKAEILINEEDPEESEEWTTYDEYTDYLIISYKNIQSIYITYYGPSTELDTSDLLTYATTALSQITIGGIAITTILTALIAIAVIWFLIKLFAHK